MGSMKRLRALIDSKPLLWGVLAVPAAQILYVYWSQDLWPDELVGPTGLWSARFILLALMLTPLSILLPRSAPVLWLVRRRRAFGVAGFGYALLHLTFYALEMETLANIVGEVELPGIWTGWAALLLLLPLAATSNDSAMRRLRAGWKRLQRLAYPAAVLALVHWVLVHDGLREALIHVAPLALLQTYRIARALRGRRSPLRSTA
jgi:methionine sulfoxide reductase heme-binding subunit